jgi:hypothetical protein
MDRLYEIIAISGIGVVGLVLLVIGFVSFRRQLDFLRGAVSTSGTIVEPRGSGGRPVFEFADRREHVHRVRGRVSHSHGSYHRGEKVKVLYRPENPESAQLDSFFECWFMPLFLCSMGTFFIGIGSVIGIVLLRR